MRNRLRRIAPHHVAVDPLMRDLLLTLDEPDLINRSNIRREAAVHAKDLAINRRRNVEKIKDFLNYKSLKQ